MKNIRLNLIRHMAITLILVVLAGTQTVTLSYAGGLDVNQPRLTLQVPHPLQVYNSSSIELSLKIVKPSAWFYDYYTWSYKPSSGIPFDFRNSLVKGYGCYGRIDYIECILDGKINQTFPIDDCTPHVFYKNQLSTLRFSQNLSVAEGRHLLKITAFGSFYPDFSSDPYRTRQIVNCSVTTSFSVWYTSPQISVISPQNITYSEQSVPITFELNRPASYVYSLDGADNTSLAGNITLTGLVEGSHSIVIYAKDLAGNVGKSECMFDVMLLTPTPSSILTCAPNITQAPKSNTTATPELTPSPTIPEFPLTTLTITVLTMAAIVGALFRNKNNKDKSAQEPPNHNISDSNF